jgi:hypothetical protein
MFLGSLANRHARGTGNWFGVVKSGMVFALAWVLPCEKFLQADDVRAGGRRFGDARERFVDVDLLRSAACRLYERNGHLRRRTVVASLIWVWTHHGPMLP